MGGSSAVGGGSRNPTVRLRYFRLFQTRQPSLSKAIIGRILSDGGIEWWSEIRRRGGQTGSTRERGGEVPRRRARGRPSASETSASGRGDPGSPLFPRIFRLTSAPPWQCFDIVTSSGALDSQGGPLGRDVWAGCPSQSQAVPLVPRERDGRGIFWACGGASLWRPPAIPRKGDGRGCRGFFRAGHGTSTLDHRPSHARGRQPQLLYGQKRGIPVRSPAVPREGETAAASLGPVAGHPIRIAGRPVQGRWLQLPGKAGRLGKPLWACGGGGAASPCGMCGAGRRSEDHACRGGSYSGMGCGPAEGEGGETPSLRPRGRGGRGRGISLQRASFEEKR